MYWRSKMTMAIDSSVKATLRTCIGDVGGGPMPSFDVETSSGLSDKRIGRCPLRRGEMGVA